MFYTFGKVRPDKIPAELTYVSINISFPSLQNHQQDSKAELLQLQLKLFLSHLLPGLYPKHNRE